MTPNGHDESEAPEETDVYVQRNNHHFRHLRFRRAVELSTQHPEWPGKKVSAAIRSELGMGLSSKPLARAMAMAARARNKASGDPIPTETVVRRPRSAPLKGDVEAAIRLLLEAMPDLVRLEVHEDGRVSFERRQIVAGTVRYR